MVEHFYDKPDPSCISFFRYRVEKQRQMEVKTLPRRLPSAWVIANWHAHWRNDFWLVIIRYRGQQCQLQPSWPPSLNYQSICTSTQFKQLNDRIQTTTSTYLFIFVVHFILLHHASTGGWSVVHDHIEISPTFKLPLPVAECRQRHNDEEWTSNAIFIYVI